LSSTGASARAAPETDLDTYRTSKRATLSTYRWVDREHGVVRLPIDQAMRLIAERNAGSEASQ